MKTLNWYVNRQDMFGNVRGYKAVIDFKICDFYISYNVFMDNADEWYLGIIHNEHGKMVSRTIKCDTLKKGKKMAQEEAEKLFDGIKKFLTEFKV